NDLAGCSNDGAGRTIVAPQGDNFGRGEIAFEPLEARCIRAAKSVDRLVGIADNAEIAGGWNEKREQAILPFVEVLEFVDRDPPKAVLIKRGKPTVFSQQARRTADEVIEVDQAMQRERALIG